MNSGSERSLRATPGRVLADRRRWISVLLGTCLGVGLLIGVIEWGGGLSALRVRRMDFAYFALFLGLSVAVYWLRACRLRVLVGLPGTILPFFRVVPVHTFLSGLLPFGTGEISYPLLVKKAGISDRLAVGVSSLVITRVQDMFISALYLGFALVWTGEFTWVAGGAGNDGRTAVLFSIAACLAPLGVTLSLSREQLSSRFPRIYTHVLEVLSSFRSTPLKTWAQSLLIALAARLLAILAVYALFLSIGLLIPFSQAFLITCLYVFLPYLPINTPASMGLAEGFLTLFFVRSGIDKSVAVGASVQIHILQLAVTGLFAGMAAASFRWSRRTSA